MKFDKQVTDVCKGLAIAMLIAHHLWYNEVPGTMPFGIIGLATRCKICVAMFVFLSGFGLARTQCDMTTVLKRRIPQLLLGYWLVAFIFIGIGTLCFGMTFEAAYPKNGVVLAILQAFGLNVVDPVGGFNPTWWYMDAIVPIYLLAPVLIKSVERFGLAVIICAAAFFDSQIVFVPWIAPFVLGVYVSQARLLERTVEHFNTRLVLPGAALLVALAFYSRFGVAAAELSDAFFAPLALVACAAAAERFPLALRFVGYLGRHCLNIFLLHTFLLVWFNATLKSVAPPFAFALLLFGSLACSLAIEFLKSAFSQLAKRVYMMLG